MAGANRPAKGKRPGRRKHSFGGCRTCRRRHVKCDQVRPSCLACRAIDAVCEGYASELKWMTPHTLSSENAGRFDNEEAGQNNTRHHLYSEASRASMSTKLKQCLGSSSVDGSLAEIDSRTNDPQGSKDGNVAIGPFSVLDFRDDSCNASSDPGIVTPETTILGADSSNADMSNVTLATDYSQMLNEMQPPPSIMDWFDPILGFDNTLHWADLFGLDFDNENSLLVPQQPPTQPELSLGFGLDDTPPELRTENIGLQHTQPRNDHTLARIQEQNETQATECGIEQEPHKITMTEVKSTSEAQSLLKHFHDLVIPQMSFMPSKSKSPWMILQLPEAVRSLAELTYLQTGALKHANAANLYGLLACSAYHLAASSATQSSETLEYWEDLFSRLRGKAKIHMQISLRDELKGPGKAKYKDQLMAILSMLACAGVSGSYRDARCYMIDAERLLRVKGLAKREISRKCRLLHHVYSWIRIVGESTYVIHDYSSYGSVVDNMSVAHRAGRLHRSSERRTESSQSKSGHNARLDDFLRLEPHSSDSDLDIDEIKEHQGALQDIHLEDSRLFGGTMYQIYGISETWLSLVSQTTRLANILDATKYGKNTDVSFVDFLQKRAGRLENIVCSFALKDPTSDDEDEDLTSPENRPPNYYMLRAMNSALVILFYRRIRNVNSLILQGHVDSVVQSLRDFDAALIAQGFEGPGSAWPAFIAGCEAKSRRNRKYIMSWLDKGFEKCGLEYFGASRRIMKEVWERQDQPTPLMDPGSDGSSQSRPQKSASYQHTWVDVLREKDYWVMLF